MIKKIICKFKGHCSRTASCPFTGNTYEICADCGKRTVIGKYADNQIFNGNKWSV